MGGTTYIVDEFIGKDGNKHNIDKLSFPTVEHAEALVEFLDPHFIIAKLISKERFWGEN
jgi:hypothetical protein